MEIYLYSADTKEFIGKGFADPNPLEAGKFLIPANAATTPPPTPVAGEVAVYDGSSWMIKLDLRGQEFFSKSTGQKVKICDIGPLPDGLTDKTPFVNAMWDEDLGAWKLDHDKALAAVRAQRNVLLIASDWTQVSDSPLSAAQKATWAAYRQKLRDFPETCDLEDPEWPVQPK